MASFSRRSLLISTLRSWLRRLKAPKSLWQSFVVFTALYRDIDGMAISLSERERLQIKDASFTYGEVTPEGVAAILDVVDPKSHEIFYDLGCGTGKAVFAASLLRNWQKCCGIELLPGLFNICLELREKFLAMPEIKKFFPHKHFAIEFYNEDFLTKDFSDGDVLFVH